MAGNNIVRAKFRIVTKDRGKDQALYKCTYYSSEALNRDQLHKLDKHTTQS